MAKKTNRVVIITGATSGIGLETAQLFKNNGDIVYALSLDNPVNIDNFYECNVANEEQVARIIQEIGHKHGHIDVLINNAGYGMSGITELIDTQSAKKLFDVNVFGVQSCTKFALPFMKNGAKIINVCSSMALFPVPYRAYYAGSKAAVLAITFAQRSEVRALGVDMMAVCPGNIKTNFTKNRPKSFETNERYGDSMQKATEKIDGEKNKFMKKMLPIVVAKKIFKLTAKKHMPPQVIISGFYKILYFLTRFVPVSLVCYLTGKTTG